MQLCSLLRNVFTPASVFFSAAATAARPGTHSAFAAFAQHYLSAVLSPLAVVVVAGMFELNRFCPAAEPRALASIYYVLFGVGVEYLFLISHIVL